MTILRDAGLALAMGMLTAGVLVYAGGVRNAADAAGEPANRAATLRSAESFASIADKDARAVALFAEAGKVIQSPRCLNCHPAGERPTQTDRMTPHQPLVVRGEGGMGAAGGLVCTTCHHETNFDAAGVPGNPKWSLAPVEMAWQGKSLGQICEQIKDKTRNGDRDLAALVEHMASDDLVGWAWHPGRGRTPAPGTQKAFGDIIKAWADAGAACPKG